MRGSLFLCSLAQSNESTGSELFDLGVVVAEDALEDIVRILAESGRAAPDLAGRSGKLGNDAEGGDFLAESLILVLDEVAAALIMRVFKAVLRTHDAAARHLELRHGILYLLRGTLGAPCDDLGVKLAALLGGDGLDTGGAVLIIVVLKVEAHGLNGALVNAGAERADGDVVAVAWT